MIRKICVITGTRAEYGLLRLVMQGINDDHDLTLQVIATGTHLSPEFGLTYREIEQDGFQIDRKVEMLTSSDTTVGIAKSMGLGMIGFADALNELRPDVIVVLGDRFEIFAATTAAMALSLPIAHISGGDITEGAIDDQIRHAITKMSHVHFVAIDQHAKRVQQMGEEVWRIHIVGEPCIDTIRSYKKVTKNNLAKLIGISFNRTTVLVTYHPVTLYLKDTIDHVKNLLSVLDSLDADIIFTYPNADAGGRIIIKEIEAFVTTHKNAVVFKSLGSKIYLNVLAKVDVIIGNSSSGIVEAPSFKLPAVNIGNRQQGRLMPPNVISTTENASSIRNGIDKALSKKFRKSLKNLINPYDRGGVANKIIKILSELDYNQSLINKKYI